MNIPAAISQHRTAKRNVLNYSLCTPATAFNYHFITNPKLIFGNNRNATNKILDNRLGAKA